MEEEKGWDGQDGEKVTERLCIFQVGDLPDGRLDLRAESAKEGDVGFRFVPGRV